MHLPAVHTLALALAAGCAYAGAALATDDHAPARPALAGSWSLNPSLSTPSGNMSGPEDRGPADGPVDLRPGGTGGTGPMGGPTNPGLPGAGRGRGTMGGGGGSGPPPGRSREDEMAARRALMAELVQLPAKLTIAQDGDRLTFRDPDGVTRVYVANGKREKHQLRNGTIETKSRWDGDALVMELKAGGRLTITRRLTVRGDPRQLEITTSFDGGPNDASRLAVYDPTDDQAALQGD